MRRVYSSTLLLAAALLVACGPISYISTVSVRATRLVSEAKTAEAERYAPYEYWSAVTYLRMAREKAGYADFQVSVDYGDRAVEMARKARQLAAERRQAGPDSAPGSATAPGSDGAPRSKAPASAAPARKVTPRADGRDDEQPPVQVVPKKTGVK